ncbi:MAG TPA: hypothetical protein VEW48_13875 [Thermoanaerobaculia bacterium]|nr:hypothetical protein [Thermoanaerobaculia bacterium]
MLRTLWGSFRALFAALVLGTYADDLPSVGSDLGKTIDPNG